MVRVTRVVVADVAGVVVVGVTGAVVRLVTRVVVTGVLVAGFGDLAGGCGMLGGVGGGAVRLGTHASKYTPLG